MKYDNLSAFEKHLTDTPSQQFKPLYLVLGKEAFECQEATQLLLRFLLPSHSRELSLSTWEASQLEEDALWTALHTRSLFCETRVIWIQQADKLKKSIQEGLEKFLARPQSSLHLILSASTWQKNTAFYKAMDQVGVILELAEIKPWEKEKRLAEWINKQAMAARKLMSYQVCQSLVRQLGCDSSVLTQELEKLFCFCEGKKEITQQDVEAICTKQQHESIWQLGEALFRRDTHVALQMAHAFLHNGHALLPLLRQLRSQFQTEYQISLLLAQGKRGPDITQEFPYMKGQILERHMWQAQHYGLDALKQGLLLLDATEMRVKNSQIEEKILIELLIVQLTT